MHTTVLTIGNAMVDILLSLPSSETRCHFDQAKGLLCVKAGEKIGAQSASISAGGGAVRVAIALKRLGYTTALAADIGEDEFGNKILNTLKGEGVMTNYVKKSAEETSTSIGINYQQERTLFTNHVSYPHALTLPDDPPQMIYLAALGEQWVGAYKTIATYLKAHESVLLAFNPGHTQLQAGADKLQEILEQTDILFVNKEEAMLLANIHEGSMQDIVKNLQTLGPKAIVITDGKHGAYLLDTEGDMYHHAIVQAPIKERTGAGDAFAAGFVAGVLEGLSFVDCLSWGICSSASVIGQLGGHAGLLTKGELKAMLERSDMPEVERITQ